MNFFYAVLLFLIPSNLFQKFLLETTYVNGVSSDYLLAKLHASDIPLLAIFLGIFFFKPSQQYNKLLVVCALLLLVTQSTASHPVISMLFLGKLIVLSTIGVFLVKHSDFLTSKITLASVNITLLFQSLLAWYQYIEQKSLFGYLFFGETNLQAYSGIAKSNLYGIEKILPYGTTAHPNILAGILSIFILILFQNRSKKEPLCTIQLLILLLAGSALVLTQSVSAILGLLLGFGVLFARRSSTLSTRIKLQSARFILVLFLLANLGVIIFLSVAPNTGLENSMSVWRRSYLQHAASQMFLDNWVGGVGLQNFTAHVETYSSQPEVVRFIQPVHNTTLLVLAETGIVGLIILVIITTQLLKKNKSLAHPEYLVALIPIAALDHYLFTTQSGLLLLLLAVITAKAVKVE